jgi:paraquat-inducible protein B
MYQAPRFNFSNLLNNASKTLNVVNQAIPIIKEVKPILNNAKTVFKIVNSLNNTNSNQVNETNYKKSNNNGPSFFI